MSQLKISSVKARAVSAPLKQPLMTAVGSFNEVPLLLIDVETDGGVVGRSYLFVYRHEVLKPLVSLISNFEESIVGKAVDPLIRFEEFERMFTLMGKQGLVGMAIGGLDMAFWDAKGKQLDVTVAELLGADNSAIPCYDSHGIVDFARDKDLLSKSLEKGFKAIKIKLGESSLSHDVETVAAVRDLIGPDVRLMVDYNQSLTAPEAIQRVRCLEDQFSLDWVEEPVRAEDFTGHATVRRNVKTPIQSGENWCMPEGAAMAMNAGISDHAMLDIMKIGGVTGWMRAAAMAQAASLPVSSHLFIEASAHVMGATPNRYLLEHLDFAGMLLESPYEIIDGHIAPKGPGLGIEWNEKSVAQYAI